LSCEISELASLQVLDDDVAQTEEARIRSDTLLDPLLVEVRLIL
jgi:hypothetical protein